MKPDVFKSLATTFVTHSVSLDQWVKSHFPQRKVRSRSHARKATIAFERLEDRTLLSAFNNSAAITTPAGGFAGDASPYPSQINVAIPAGVTATVLDVNVSIGGLTSTFPADLDVLVAGPVNPNTNNVILMSDTGGGNSIAGVDLTFDDSAASSLTSGTITSGSYKPTNLAGVVEPDVWPSPAPTPNVGNTLSTFNGTNINGLWSLFVVDDTDGDSSTIANGWSLNFTLGGDVTINAGADAGDGTPDTIAASIQGSDLVVIVNGAVVFDEPYAGITSLTINGSSDNDTMTFDGDDQLLSFPLSFTGGGGTDSLDVVDADVEGVSSGNGLTASDFDTVTVFSSQFDGNEDHGIAMAFVGTVNISLTNAENNDSNGGGTGAGVQITNATGLVSISGGAWSGNGEAGIAVFTGAGVEIDNVTADGNGQATSNSSFDGVTLVDVGDVTISDSTFDNNFRDGIHIENAGDVVLDPITAINNGAAGPTDAGVYVDTAASFSDTDGTYSGNVTHGIHLIDIAGDVTLVRTTANDNDDDNNGVGDGLFATANVNATAIGGNLLIQGSTFQDTAPLATHQRHGVNVASVTGDVTFEDSTGVVQSNVVTGNALQGVLIGAIGGSLTITSGTFSSNGLSGIDTTSTIGGDLIVTGADANDNGGDGLTFSDVVGGQAIFTGVGVDGNDFDGMDLNGVVGDTILTGVDASGNGDSGAELSDLTDVVITGGTFNGNTGLDGINLQTATGTVTLAGVTANGNGDDGVDITGVTGLTTLTTVTAEDNGENGAEIGNLGDLLFTGGSYVSNDDDGLELGSAGSIGDITLDGVTVNDNGGQGIDGSWNTTYGIITITDGTYNGNDEEGIVFDGATSVGMTNVTATGNGDDGVRLVNSGDITVTGGTFSDNAVDGIDLQNVGAVVMADLTANGNDPGINVNGAASYSLTNSIVSLNDDGGVYLANITGPVSLTNVTATENDADEDNIGDGFNATVVTGPIVILGGTYSDPDVDADDQQNGIVVTASPSAGIFVGNDGVTINPVTASGNIANGIDIDGVLGVSLDTVIANSNGAFGFDISNTFAVVLTDLTLAANTTDGGRVSSVLGLAYTTNKSTNPAVDDTLTLSPTLITRNTPVQQPIEYTAVGILSIFTGQGNDTINVTGTGATISTTVYGGSGDDQITVDGSNLTASNSFQGDTFEDEFVTNTLGGVILTPAAAQGNDEFILNVPADITGTSLLFGGNGNAPAGVADSANRDRLTINNAGAVTKLSFDWSAGGNFDTNVNGFAIPVNISTTETVQYNDTNGTDTVATLVGETTDDEITVVPVSIDSAAAFIGGNPYESTAEPLPFADSLPGFAGGGVEADFSFTGLINAAGIFVDGNGSAGPVGDQLFVYGQTEDGVIDPVALAANYTIFNNLATYGAGELVDAIGLGNAFDDITLTDTLVTVNNYVQVALDPNDFKQIDPTLTSGLIVDSGDELVPTVPDPDCDGFRADSIDVSLSQIIPLTVNGGDPPDNGVNHQGDEVNFLGTFLEVQVWSDKSVPPTVSFNFIPFVGSFQPYRESSIECHGPIDTLTLTLVGDNNDPLVDQTDNFVVVGEDVDVLQPGGDLDGANELSLVINGSIDIPFTGVQVLNVLGDDLTAAGDNDADTLELTPWADYTNGGLPPSSPIGWGIQTNFNEGGITGADDGDQQDLLIMNGISGVSEVTTLTPSDEEDGQVTVAFPNGALIANVNYVSNLGFIFNANDGSAGDTDNLILKGTDGVTPGTSGDENVVVNYSATGNAASPFITMADANGGLLYSIHNITNFDVVHLDLLAGNDSVTILDTGAGGAGFANTVLSIDAGDGNDTLSAAGSTTTRGYTLNGGAGNDVITGGVADDVLEGGDGDDAIIDLGGNDTIRGGAGNDLIQLIASGLNDLDVIDGGDGLDAIGIFGTAGADTFTADVGFPPPATPTTAVIAMNGQVASTFGVENVGLFTGAGADTVDVGDLTGTDVRVFGVDVGGAGSADTVTVHARSSDDNLSITATAADAVKLTGLTYDVLVISTTPAATLVVNGEDGDDTIKAATGTETAIGITLNGDAGDDYLSADATINGGAGNDTLEGGAGADTINGNEGDDTILFNAGTGVDTIDGGAGFNTFLITGSGAANTIAVAEGAVTVDGFTETLAVSNLQQFHVIAGGGSDTVTVNLATVSGLIEAGDGDDTVNGSGSGAALTIEGGDGNDTLTGGTAADNIGGGAGNDTLAGGAGDDTISGGAGNDAITGGVGTDTLDGGDGTDTFTWSAGDGSDTVVGGDDGADSLVFNGSAAANVIGLNAVNNHLNVTLGAITVDTVGIEHVQVNGLAGGDTITVGDLTTTALSSLGIALGGGADSVIVNGRNTADNLAVSTAGAGLVSVEGLAYDVDLTGAAVADLLTVNGNNGDDTLKANADVEAQIGIVLNGNDGDDYLSADATLNGGNGNDTLEGGAGADTINGNDGDDTIIFNAGTGVDTIDGGNGFDLFLVDANGLNNTIAVSQTAVTVDGNTETLAVSNLELFQVNSLGGNDTVTVTLTTVAGNIDAGSGNDTVDGSAATAALTIFGGDGEDTLTGGSVADEIHGGSGNDLINGGGGIDFEYGDTGNDTFGPGDAGADFLFGSEGADTFNWQPGDGSDAIQGGDDQGDVLNFLGSAAADAFLLSSSATNPSHLNVNLGVATVDTAGVDQVIIGGLAGADTVTVLDLTKTEVKSLNIDLGAGDADAVTLNGRVTGDDIGVDTPVAGTLNVQGLSYDVNILNVAVADTLTINGNAGDDSIKANVGVESTVTIVFNGNAGDDFLSADATLNGGDGNDTLIGGAGADTLNGGNGNDLLTGNGGIDAFDGGDGYDTVVETRNADFTLTDTTLNIGAEGTDTLANMENANLTGGLGANTFFIGSFTGDTTVTGAGGSDTVDFSTATEAIHIDLDAKDQDQVINLSGRTVVFGDIIENLTATPFNDTINVDIAQFNRTINGGLETSIPPGDRLNVDLLGSNATSTKIPNGGKLGSFNGTVNGSGFTGTISYFDIETLVIKGANSTPPDFSSSVQYDVGDGPRGVVTADVNGDGKLDMIVANSISNNISVRFGDGFGSFGALVNYSAGGKHAKQTTTVAVGDVDNDGDLDIVVTNRKTNNVSVLLNDGTGVFGAATLFSTGSKQTGKFPTAVKLGDMNNDGNLDIVTANANVRKNGSVSVLLGDGAGGFGAANVTKTLGRRPRDLVLIDNNGDGNLDVVATDLFSRNVVLMNGDGAGGLSAPAIFDVGVTPNSIIEGDFNGDGVLDVVTTSLLSPRLSLLLGVAGGGFLPEKEIKYPAVKLDISINTADINGDGNLDLLIANRNDNTLSYMLGNGNGSFNSRVDFKTGDTRFREPVSIAVGDFNNDGAIDLMVANAGSDDVSVLIHVGIV